MGFVSAFRFHKNNGAVLLPWDWTPLFYNYIDVLLRMWSLCEYINQSYYFACTCEWIQKIEVESFLNSRLQARMFHSNAATSVRVKVCAQFSTDKSKSATKLTIFHFSTRSPRKRTIQLTIRGIVPRENYCWLLWLNSSRVLKPPCCFIENYPPVVARPYNVFLFRRIRTRR